MAGHGELTGEGREGEREEGRGRLGGLGYHGEGLLRRSSVAAPLSVLLMRSVSERKQEGERRRKRKGRKRKEKKKKIWEIFQT
jgi:hypothetical protein